MARHPDMAEVLANRRAFIASHKARKDPRKLSRAKRRAIAPKPPRGSVLVYLRGIGEVLAEVRSVLQGILPDLVRDLSTPGAPGVGVPRMDHIVHRGGEWLLLSKTEPGKVLGKHPTKEAAEAQERAIEANKHRTDALKGPFVRRLGPLEMAISAKLSKKHLGVMLTDVAASVEAHNREEMSRVLRINLRDPSHGLQPWIEDFVDRNVKLIRFVAFDQLEEMEGLVAEATAGQVRVESLADDLMERFNVTESRAALIARDQTLKANANLTQLRQQQAGVTKYIWTVSGDERVRGRPGGKWADSDSDHWSLDGTVQDWTNPPITNPKTGARNHPGEDYQCRCTATPIVEDLLGPSDASEAETEPGDVGDWGAVGPQSPWAVEDSRRGRRRSLRR